MDMEKAIEVDVKEQVADLVKNLDSARKEDRFCDVTIKVGSEKIPCHKIVLSEGCDFFKGMFAHRMKENESGVAEMEGVDPECMVMCVDYIYTGKVSIPEGKVLELLQTAHMLQLTKLCDRIVFYFEKRLGAESFFATRKIASTLSLKRMQEICNEFASKNFKCIAAIDEFKDLEEEYLSFLIGSKDTEADESIKCKALLIWSNFDVESRTKVFEEIFLGLDFTKMPKKYLNHLIENEELVFNSSSCLRKLLRTFSGFSDAGCQDVDLKGDAQDSGSNVIAVFDQTSKAVQAFNPEQKTWVTIKAVTNEINSKIGTAVVMGDCIYVLLDDGTNYRLDLSQTTLPWQALPKRQFRAPRVAATVVNSAVYAFDNNFVNSKSVEKLEANGTDWMPVRSKSVVGALVAVASSKDSIYCFGGDCGRFMEDVLRLNPVTEEWTTLSNMPTPRYGAAAVYEGDKFYVSGGHGAGRAKINNVECYDTTTDNWSSISGMVHCRGIFNSFVMSGKIFAIGGCAGSPSTIEEFDPEKDTWKVTEDLKGKAIHKTASVSFSFRA